MTIALVLVALGIVAALVYWELVIAEGVHLGPRVVTFLYDLTAARYNRIKQFTPDYEDWFLGEPLAQVLSHVPAPLVLDVATGTGRLPITLLRQPGFRGYVFGLDRSRAMLTQAARGAQTNNARLRLIWQDICHLPFENDTFDAVTCIEALEFFPDTRQAIQESLRVLRPGGALLVTNRIGLWARFLPGHTQSRPVFEAMLASLGLTQVQTQTWQVDYDLVWAIKPGRAPRRGGKPPDQILRCPRCHGALARAPGSFACSACGRAYPIAADGVIEMMQ